MHQLLLLLTLLSLVHPISGKGKGPAILPPRTQPPQLLGPPNLSQWSWIPSSPDMTDQAQHYSFGWSLGTHFTTTIQDRMSASTYVQELVAFFHDSPTYTQYLHQNNVTYPMYVLELEGIAKGSKVPFETLFINQMSEEFSYFYAGKHTNIKTNSKQDDEESSLARNPERCSDLVWISESGVPYLVHNEDSGGGDVNHTALISAPQGVGKNGVPFTTYTYLGNIPTGAYGWNKHDLLFTMNYVAPSNADLAGGLVSLCSTAVL